MVENKRKKLAEITNKINKVLKEYGEPEKCTFVSDSELMDLDVISFEDDLDLYPDFKIEFN